MRLVEHSRQQAFRNQSSQTIRQNLTSDAKMLLPLLKSSDTEKRITQNEQRPAIADNIKRSGQRGLGK